MSVVPEKLQYCRDAFVQQGLPLTVLSRQLDISESTLRKSAEDEQWRIQRARFLVAERHRLQTDDGVDFLTAAKRGPKSNELHALCLNLFCQKDMRVSQIANLTGVPVGTVRRWKWSECWDEQKAELQASGESVVGELVEPSVPDYRQTIARHLFVKQRLTLEVIHNITGLELSVLRQLRDAEQWVKELASYRPPSTVRSLTEELKAAAQSLQVFLVQQCDELVSSNINDDPRKFENLNRTIKSVQSMIGQFSFLNVSIIQDVINGYTDYCIAEVGKGRMTIGEMNTIFNAAMNYCEGELNAVAPDDIYYEMPELDESDSERDESPTSVPGREPTASGSALVAL